MKTIKVLGSGCTKCKNTFELIKQVSQQLGVSINLEVVEPLTQVMAYGVMSTLTVVVDEEIVHKGSVPVTSDIETWIRES